MAQGEIEKIIKQNIHDQKLEFIHMSQYLSDQLNINDIEVFKNWSFDSLYKFKKERLNTGLLFYNPNKYEIVKIRSIEDLIKNTQVHFTEEDTISHSDSLFQELIEEIELIESNYKNRNFIESLPVNLFEKIHAVNNYLSYLKQTNLVNACFYSTEKSHRYSDKAKHRYFYRGHGCINYQLVPKVFRSNIYFHNEHNLYKEIQVRNADRFLTGSGRLELLTTMQHYGLPTRLLDMSASPLIALYFAVSEIDHHNRDGELIVFNLNIERIKYFDSDTVEILTALSTLTPFEKIELAQESLNFLKLYSLNVNSEITKKPHKMKSIVEQELDNIIEKYNKISIVKKVNNEIEKEFGIHLGEINPFDLFNIIPVQPKQTNERIIRQQGAFIAYGLMGKDVARQLTEKILYSKENKILKYIIPAENKKKILNDLEFLGINASTVYPELDKVAEYLQFNL